MRSSKNISSSASRCWIDRIQPDPRTVWLRCLEGTLCYVLAGCVDSHTHYWAKYGVSQEQIRRDNLFCADMTAIKRNVSSHSGEWFYFAPLDRPAYRQCMTSQGYRMVTKEELQHGVPAAMPDTSMQQLQSTRKLCERVAGEVGDVNSCIRWMSLNLPTDAFPASTSASSELSGVERSTAAPVTETDKTGVCLRRNPHAESGLLTTLTRSCEPPPSEPQ